jgi:hypothetical protein
LMRRRLNTAAMAAWSWQLAGSRKRGALIPWQS